MIGRIEEKGLSWTLTLALLVLPAVLTGCDEPAAAQVASATSLSAADQAQGFSGTWVLNPEASELPWRDRVRDERGGPPEGGPPEGRARRWRQRDGRDGPPEGLRRRGPRFGRLEILQDQASVTITRGRRSITLPTDGSTETRETPRGHSMEVSATLEDGALVIRHSVADRMSMVRTFSLSDDGQQMVVRHELEHPERGTREFRLVYDRG